MSSDHPARGRASVPQPARLDLSQTEQVIIKPAPESDLESAKNFGRVIGWSIFILLFGGLLWALLGPYIIAAFNAGSGHR